MSAAEMPAVQSFESLRARVASAPAGARPADEHRFGDSRPASPSGPARRRGEAAIQAATIRPLDPAESDLLCDHLMRLDGETRRLRFGNCVNDVFLARYSDLALGSDCVVLGCFVEGALRGVAELRVLDPAGEDAEGAFSIETAFQGVGHGNRLFGRLIQVARRRGVRRLYLTCLRENARMQRIASRHGADISVCDGDVMAQIRREPLEVAMPQALPPAAPAFDPPAQPGFSFALIEWRRRHFDLLLRPFRGLSPLSRA